MSTESEEIKAAVRAALRAPLRKLARSQARLRRELNNLRDDFRREVDRLQLLILGRASNGNGSVHLHTSPPAAPAAPCPQPLTPNPSPPRVDADEPFVPSPYQAAILEALEGKALRTDALAAKVGDRSRLFRKPTGGIAELQDHGMVRHHPRLGYYRPDAPPAEIDA